MTTLTIITPEHVEIRLEPAGPGSRFLAIMIDSTITLGASILLYRIAEAVLVAQARVGAEKMRMGRLNPADWGQQVKEQVSDCKAALPAGHHGIGNCVSDFANQHGKLVSSAARHHGDGDGHGKTKDKDKDKESGTPQDTEKVQPGEHKPADARPTNHARVTPRS